jgi:hypothetical protein
MSDSGFTVEATLPFSWQPGPALADLHRSNQLLLHVANLLDVHEPEHAEANKRLEAKLDLMLHWLGQHLFGAVAAQPAGNLTLGANSVAWAAGGVPCAEGEGVLNVALHPDLPAPLRLAGRLHLESGRCHVEFALPDEETAEAWNRWLFRLHRRAIHDARHNAAPV